MRTKLFFLLLILFPSCDGAVVANKDNPSKPVQVSSKPAVPRELTTADFDRSISFNRLKDKVANNQPLFIHVRVALCDNENQGIVPVPTKLGNGLDLRNNLYWGAKYGVKNYFKRYSDWRFIESTLDLNKDVLERIIFHKKHPNKANVYLIVDAYRGDRMKVCMEDFVHSISGDKKNFISVEGQEVGIDGNADLLVFNGHNGLMDVRIELVPSKDDLAREASVIGCVSHDYFKDHLKMAKGRPVLMTTNLMAPEAYVLEALVNSWSTLKEESEIRVDAGKAYHAFQKCGLRGATKLFRHGW